MRTLRRLTAAVLLLLAAWLTVSWVEAGKEVRVLCEQFEPGDRLADVLRQLETGHYLRYTVRREGAAQTITFHSRHNLRTTRCTVRLEKGVVHQSHYLDGR